MLSRSVEGAASERAKDRVSSGLQNFGDLLGMSCSFKMFELRALACGI